MASDPSWIDRRGQIVHVADVCQHFKSRMERAQNLLGHRTGRDPAYGFARRSAPAALPISDPVLGFVGEIGVGRPVGFFHLGVSLRASVFVRHQDGDRSTEGAPFENAGENLAAIGFGAWRRDRALTGPAAIELQLDIFLAQLNPRWATIDDHAHAATVGLAPGGDAKELSEAAAHVAES